MILPIVRKMSSKLIGTELIEVKAMLPPSEYNDWLYFPFEKKNYLKDFEKFYDNNAL